MHDATAVAKSAFSEVWVLWKAKLYRLWKDAAQNSLIVNTRCDDDLSAEELEQIRRFMRKGA